MQIGLDGLKTGREAIVTSIQTGEHLRKRLRVFGFVPGTRVCCRYRSPGGQIRAIECRGTVIALRAGDLKQIMGDLL